MKSTICQKNRTYCFVLTGLQRQGQQRKEHSTQPLYSPVWSPSRWGFSSDPSPSSAESPALPPPSLPSAHASPGRASHCMTSKADWRHTERCFDCTPYIHLNCHQGLKGENSNLEKGVSIKDKMAISEAPETKMACRQCSV